MNKTIIGGIIINVIMIVIIICIVIYGIIIPSNELTLCETEQSVFCYTIQCPCDITNDNLYVPTDNSEPPCFGYAKMPADDQGNWYCSSAPRTKIDSKGNIL